MKKFFFTDILAPIFVNEEGKTVLLFEKTKALPTREAYEVKDGVGQKLGKIEKIRSNFGLVDLPRIVIKLRSKETIEILKEMEAFKEYYQLHSDVFFIEGDCDSANFSIQKEGETAAIITTLEENSENRYEMELLLEDCKVEIMSILFSIVWVLNDEKIQVKR